VEKENEKGMSLISYSFYALIILAFIFFLLGFLSFIKKGERITLWGLGKKVRDLKDKEGYKRFQGINSIIMGFIFLLIPISKYLVDKYNINPNILYIWFIILFVEIIIRVVKEKKYFY